MFVAPAYAQTAGEAHGAGETHTETGVAGEGHGGGFPPFETTYFPSQLLWLAITFGLFYLFLQRVVMPRIGKILDERHARIASDLDRAAAMKAEADAAVAAYEQELAEARNRANQISQEARDAAKLEAEAERKKVQAGLDARLAEAEARIAGIKTTALKDVGAIAEETAGAIVRELVGAAPDKASVAAAVRRAGE